MINQTQDNNILWKIKKLLALADTKANSNPNEAALAAAKAQELLFKHNLSMMSIDGLQDQDTESIGKEEWIAPDVNRSSLGWAGPLLNSVCKANFCRVIRLNNGSAKYAIIGKPSNIQVSQYLFSYLKGEIDRLSKQSIRTEGVIDKKTTWIRSFCFGAISAVDQKLRDQKRQDTQSNSTSTALVVISDKQLDTALRSYFPHSHTSSRSRVSDRGAYGAGINAGRNISIRQGVTGQGQRYIN